MASKSAIAQRMKDIFANLKTNQTVFKRTKTLESLPKLGVYVEWIAGQQKRRLQDPEGVTHDIDDKVLQSSYRLVSKANSKKLLAEHWPKLVKEKKS